MGKTPTQIAELISRDPESWSKAERREINDLVKEHFPNLGRGDFKIRNGIDEYEQNLLNQLPNKAALDFVERFKSDPGLRNGGADLTKEITVEMAEQQQMLMGLGLKPADFTDLSQAVFALKQAENGGASRRDVEARKNELERTVESINERRAQQAETSNSMNTPENRAEIERLYKIYMPDADITDSNGELSRTEINNLTNLKNNMLFRHNSAPSPSEFTGKPAQQESAALSLPVPDGEHPLKYSFMNGQPGSNGFVKYGDQYYATGDGVLYRAEVPDDAVMKENGFPSRLDVYENEPFLIDDLLKRSDLPPTFQIGLTTVKEIEEIGFDAYANRIGVGQENETPEPVTIKIGGVYPEPNPGLDPAHPRQQQYEAQAASAVAIEIYNADVEVSESGLGALRDNIKSIVEGGHTLTEQDRAALSDLKSGLVPNFIQADDPLVSILDDIDAVTNIPAAAPVIPPKPAAPETPSAPLTIPPEPTPSQTAPPTPPAAPARAPVQPVPVSAPSEGTGLLERAGEIENARDYLRDLNPNEVKAMQEKLGVEPVDGKLGKVTMAAIEKEIETNPDLDPSMSFEDIRETLGISDGATLMSQAAYNSPPPMNDEFAATSAPVTTPDMAMQQDHIHHPEQLGLG